MIAAVDYCIRVEGHLEPNWSGWFDGMTARCQPDGTTLLLGPVRDQAALHGLLLKVRDLGLPLISVNPVEPSGEFRWNRLGAQGETHHCQNSGPEQC